MSFSILQKHLHFDLFWKPQPLCAVPSSRTVKSKGAGDSVFTEKLVQTIGSWKTTFVQMLQGCFAFQQFCFRSVSLCVPVHPHLCRQPGLAFPNRAEDSMTPQPQRDPSARLGFCGASAPRWCQCWKLGRELSSPLFSVTPHVLINDEVLMPMY